VSESDELQRLPDDRIEPSRRKLSELRPGERVALSVITDIAVDEEGHVWVDIFSCFSPASPLPVVPGLSLRAERTETGFILWLDKKVKFRLGKLYPHGQYLPVVEFREAPKKADP
jgi:hypothetical protein